MKQLHEIQQLLSCSDYEAELIEHLLYMSTRIDIAHYEAMKIFEQKGFVRIYSKTETYCSVLLQDKLYLALNPNRVFSESEAFRIQQKYKQVTDANIRVWKTRKKFPLWVYDSSKKIEKRIAASETETEKFIQIINLCFKKSAFDSFEGQTITDVLRKQRPIFVSELNEFKRELNQIRKYFLNYRKTKIVKHLVDAIKDDRILFMKLLYKDALFTVNEAKRISKEIQKGGVIEASDKAILNKVIDLFLQETKF